MNQPINRVQSPEVRENFVAGLVGAFLGALVGGILWFGLYQLGIFSALSGLVGVILAIKGYSWLAKKESLKGLILSTVIAFLVLALAWYLCLAFDIHSAYESWYAEGEVDYVPTIGECVQVAPLYLADSEIGPAYFKDLAIGLILAAIGAFSAFMTTLRGLKAVKVDTSAPITPLYPVSEEAPKEENTAEMPETTPEKEKNEENSQ